MTKFGIGSIMLLCCALFCAAFTFTASADFVLVEYHWNVAYGNWSDGSNWDPAGPPVSDASNVATPYIDNGGTAIIDADILDGSVQHIYLDNGTINQSGSTVNIGRTLHLANDLSGTATYNLDGGTLNVLYLASGRYNGVGNAYFNMTGGQINAVTEIRLGNGADGYTEFNLTGGTINVTNNFIVGGESLMGNAVLNHGNGDIFVGQNFVIGSFENFPGTCGHGIYNMSGGTLATSKDMCVGSTNLLGGYLPDQPYDPGQSSDGRLFFTGGYITTAQNLRIYHPDSYINDSAAPGGVGGTIEVWGDVHNYSEARLDFDMRHTTLILHGLAGWDGSEWHVNTLDMNSWDCGASVDGLDINFAIGNLVFSGQPGTSQWYRLESDIYCYGLSIEDGACIDLNGYNIYYMPQGAYSGISASTYQLAGQWFNLNGGDGDVIAIAPVPEPATIILIGSGILAFAGVVRRRLA